MYMMGQQQETRPIGFTMGLTVLWSKSNILRPIKNQARSGFFNLLLTRRRIHLSTRIKTNKTSPTREIMKKYFVTAMVLLATTTAVFAQRRSKTPPNQPVAKDSASLVNK